MNKIGYNIQAQGLNTDARNKLLAHLLEAKPTTLVVINDKAFAHAIAASLPDTLVFHRQTDVRGGGHIDDNIHRHMTPEDFWAAATAGLPRLPNLGVYANNEPDFSDECIQWCTDVAYIAVADSRPVVIGNWSVGMPGESPSNLQRATALVNLSAQFPEVVIGLHEYAVLYWVDRRDENGRVIKTAPTGNEPPTLWYMGRWKFWAEAFPGVPFKVVITEWGFDDPAGQYTGQLDCLVQWAQWGETNGQTFAYEQLRDAENEHYKSSQIVGMTLFTYGHIQPTPDQDWSDFDWARWGVFLNYVKAHVSPADAPVSTPSLGQGYYTVNLSAGIVLNMRSTPDTLRIPIAQLRTGDVVFLKGEAIEGDDYTWERVTYNGLTGWIARVPVLTLQPAAPPDPLPNVITVTAQAGGATYAGEITRLV